MFLAILNDKSLEKYFQHIIEQIEIPITLDVKNIYFSKIEITFTQKDIILKSINKILKISLPLTLKNFQTALMKILSDYKISFQDALYYPINHSVFLRVKKLF